MLCDATLLFVYPSALWGGIAWSIARIVFTPLSSTTSEALSYHSNNVLFVYLCSM